MAFLQNNTRVFGAFSVDTTATITGTFAAVSTVTGALQVRGGVGIGGNLYIGNSATILSTAAASSIGTGALYVAGGASFNGDIYSGSGFFTGVVGVSGASAAVYGTGDLVVKTGGTQGARCGLSLTNNGGMTIYGGSNTLNAPGTAGLGLTISGGDGTISLTNNAITNSTSPTSGVLQVQGGVGITNNLYVGGGVNATSTSNGALVVSGGVGIGNDLWVGGTITANKLTVQLTTITTTLIQTDDIIQTYNTTQATSTNTGALLIQGGAGIGSNIYVGGNSTVVGPSTVTNFTAATNTSTGALQVRGGVGVGGSVYAAAVFDQGNRVVTSVVPVGGTNIGITGLTSVGTATTFTINNYGVQTLTAGTDTVVSSTTGTITLWDASTLQTVTNRGFTTTNQILVNNFTQATTTNTGALVVTGGAGIGKDLFVGGVVSATIVTIKNTASAITNLFTSTIAPTTDQVTISNSGFPAVTAGVSNLQMYYVGGAAAIEASAARIDLTPGTTTGGTWNGFRTFVTTDATTGVTLNGLKLDNIATPGAGTSNAVYVGTGWDSIISYSGTNIISGTGAVTALGGTNAGTTNTGVLIAQGGLGVWNDVRIGGGLTATSMVVTAAISTTSNTTTVPTTDFVKRFGGFRGQIIITTPGSGTGTIPSFGINKLKVTVVGGGGGGGGNPATALTAGGGGGGAATTVAYFTTATGSFDGQTYSYVVGAGGTTGTNVAGNTGIASLFTLTGLAIYANGGLGGALGTTSIAAGGAATGTTYSNTAGLATAPPYALYLPGTAGGSAFTVGTQTVIGGPGGGGYQGMGGAGMLAWATASTSRTGNTGTSYGAGGGGSVCGATTGVVGAGGVGGGGIIIIEY